MIETEAKILEINHKKVEQILKKAGAALVFDDEMYAEYFCLGSGKKYQKKTIRLRKEGQIAMLAFKQKMSARSAKKCKETEICVSSFTEAKKILGLLGFQSIAKLKKHRTSYRLGSASFEIDRYLDKHSFVPEFLEIEAKSVSEIHKYAMMLGFEKKDCLAWSGKDVIRHYMEKKAKKKTHEKKPGI